MKCFRNILWGMKNVFYKTDRLQRPSKIRILGEKKISRDGCLGNISEGNIPRFGYNLQLDHIWTLIAEENN